MSNLGGGVGLGLSSDYATTYSDYLTIQQSYDNAGQNLFAAAGCTNSTLDAQIACLRAIPAIQITGLSAVARYVVQDGTYVVTPRLEVSSKNKNVAHIPVIFGITHDDGASIASYPKNPVTSELQGIQATLGINSYWAQTIIDSGLFPYYDTGNVTLDSFNVSARVTTDIQFRCIDQATIYAGATSGAFKEAWFYEIERTYTDGGYDPNGLGGPPNNDTNLPYFRQHGSDMPTVFGNLASLRNADDLSTIQLGTAYFGAFTRQLQPNPDPNYLKARGYTDVLAAIAKTSKWESVTSKNGPIRLIDHVPAASGFVDLPQCAWLNYSLEYYFTNH
jgi:hypothetical protein